MGRAAIAMAAVRSGTCESPGRVIDPSSVRPPTDATQWRPYLETSTKRETGDRMVSWGFVPGSRWRESCPPSSAINSVLFLDPHPPPPPTLS
jgi:hypothetical protein